MPANTVKWFLFMMANIKKSKFRSNQTKENFKGRTLGAFRARSHSSVGHELSYCALGTSG